MPDGVAKWLQGWQTLIGATVATIAAGIAFRNLTQAQKLETHRRQRKHASQRATLPLALSQISSYAKETAKALRGLIDKCQNETLPTHAIRSSTFYKTVPSEALNALAEFIEYSDDVNVDVLASTLALIQIHDSRLREMVSENADPSSSHMILRSNIENSIIDAATISAGAASAFAYARRRQNEMPPELLWDDVIRALRTIGFWEDEHPRLHDAITRRSASSRGPFDVFSVPHPTQAESVS